MRRFALIALLLSACTLTAPGGGPEGVPTEAIEVTPLDGPEAAAPAAAAATATPAETVAAEEGTAAAPADGGSAPEEAAGGEAAEGEADAAADPATADPAVAEPPPAPVLSPEAQACVKRGGRWVGTGSGEMMACVKITRDAGKQCRVKGDCQGECLARSRTCAPYTPLFGCNEVLGPNGERSTICID